MLLLLTFLMVGFGLVMVFSASSAYAGVEFSDKLYYVKRQVVFAVFGTLLMFTLMNIHYTKLKKWFLPILAIVVVMLIVVLFRPDRNGARSWFLIGSLGIQPAEFAKLAIILYLSALISKKGEKFRDLRKGLIPALLVVGGIAMLIMAQPDLGTCIIFVACALTVIVAGGANLLHLTALVGVLGSLATAVIGIYSIIKEDLAYRLARFTCFLDPWHDTQNACFQILQARYAFGHGGITGAGIGQSIQKLHYLPEAHNDYIFAIIGEEVGFVGSTLFLLIYLLFLWRGLIVALRCPDNFGTLVGTGIMGMLGVQAFINIGGVTGAIPATGVTLPFVSAGGSSLLVCMASLGVLLSISREQRAVEDAPPRRSGTSLST